MHSAQERRLQKGREGALKMHSIKIKFFLHELANKLSSLFPADFDDDKIDIWYNNGLLNK